MNNHNTIEPEKFSRETVIKPAEFRPSSTDGIKIKRTKTGVILTTIVIILGASILWFVFTAKSVYIDVEPIDAMIDLDGGIKLKLADRYLTQSGIYQISINFPRYYPLEQDLIIGEEQNQKYSFQLQRLPGHLNLVTTPANDVEIWIDNEFRGNTPMVVRNLTHGTHTIELAADRFLPFSETIEIEGLDQEQEIQIELTPAWGDVAFSSQPAGADVIVSDEIIGQTPLTSEILQGDHDIRIKLSGYKAWSDTISVTANEAMILPTITLEEADAVIYLETTPAKANVTVSGEYKGLTPIEVALAPGKTVDIRFFKEGYQRAKRTLTIESGDDQRLQVKLQPEFTAIDFNIIPSDAGLYIDGIFRGRADQTLNLTTRPHNIEIKKEGFVDYKTTITPRLGVEQQVNISLKTLQQAKLESIKPVIETSAGQTLKLFYPSGFTMGASRREPGRRANETLRNVTLNRPFYLSLNEITNKEYHAFDSSHSSGDVQGNTLNSDRQPVVNITWEQAALYCNWLSEQDSLQPFYIVESSKIAGMNRNSNGYRMPTEAEWAWAARVVGRAQILKFPWGERLPPLNNSGNFADDTAAHLLGRIVSGYNDGFAVTAPVGSFEANSKGIFDMGGNASEWVHDFYEDSISAANRSEINPVGPASGKFHVIRGSSWAHGSITELRLSYRYYGNKPRYDDVGFRIARFLE